MGILVFNAFGHEVQTQFPETWKNNNNPASDEFSYMDSLSTTAYRNEV